MPRLGLLNSIIKDLNIEQLNKIPTGFNNNIIWNLGHLVYAQQGICYKRAGVEPIVSEDFFTLYSPGTKPERFIDESELETIKELLTSTLDRLIIDYEKDLFANYTPWTTRYGVDLNNIDDVLNFLPFHDGLHIGYIMAQKRVVLGLV